MELQFIRIERDCTANIQARASGKTSRLIYDFDILANGVKLGSLRRNDIYRRFDLKDKTGEYVRSRPDQSTRSLPHIITAPKIDAFPEITKSAIDSALFPTDQQIAEREIAKAERKRRAEEFARQERRDRLLSAAAPAMYEALTKIIEIVEYCAGAQVKPSVIIETAKGALAKADGTTDATSGG